MVDTKRIMDVTLSAIGLVALSPVLAAVAVAVKLDSRGPVLFGHDRVGKDFATFKVWKFRTMRTGTTGPQLTTATDSRITRVGRMLRNSKLDELPQLYNVLIGEMSLVGPRPEVSEYVEIFKSDYATILTVRPGLTDPAAISFRNEQSLLAESSDPEQTYRNEILPKKLELSATYVAEQSVRNDCRLILRTLSSIISETRL